MSTRLNFSNIQENITTLANVSSELRGTATNLNYDNIKTTELYGTAPFRARGIQSNEIDVESKLRKSEYIGGVIHKDYYEMREFVIKPKINVRDAKPRSTRADVRNKIKTKR